MYRILNLGQAGARAGSMGERWWMHHISNTRGYLEGSLMGDKNRALTSLHELWQAVLDWQKITGSWAAAVLMAEHTALAKDLIDGFAQKTGGTWTSTMADALGKNVESSSKLFPRQPEEFARLFGEHTRLAGAYITDLADGRTDDFDAHFKEALKNGELLAAFTDQVFGHGHAA